jgi:hypothetical protein
MIIDAQKWHEIVDRWSGILAYAQEVRTSHAYVIGSSKKRDEKGLKIINKNDLTEWEITLIQNNPFVIGHESDYYLIENKDDMQNIQHKSLTIEELDELFYPYRLYESIISENANRFLDVPVEITDENKIPAETFRFTFQQKINDDSYIYRMDFILPDSENPILLIPQFRLITLSKAEILDGVENPRGLFDEQIEIFRILKKEGVVK